MRLKGTIILLFLLGVPLLQAQTQQGAGNGRNVTGVTIRLIESKTSGQRLIVRYQISNGSTSDIWLCESISQGDFEIYVPGGTETLNVRRRLNVPTRRLWQTAPGGRYVRLAPGGHRMESLLLPLPVRPYVVFGADSCREDTLDAKRLALEIGYYSCDLPEMISTVLREAEPAPHPEHESGIVWYFSGLVDFNMFCEFVRDREQAIIIPYTGGALKGEQVLSLTVEDIRIPYDGGRLPDTGTLNPFPKPPDLAPCTRIEIAYQPSMLEFFFPWAGEQCLFSSAEKQYLQGQKAGIVDSPERIRAFANEVKRANYGTIVSDDGIALLTCYGNEKVLASLTLYGDRRFLGEDHQQFHYPGNMASLRALVPQIQPFELRVECARNLRNLWHRLCLYQLAKEPPSRWSSSVPAYPEAAIWCDALVKAYEERGSTDAIMRPHRCPGGGEGRSHYAMNPNCLYGSAPDTVLLFETRSGWNQHGGPELFAFDNHDPKGGCVLLNNGTVRFIRTKEELGQLRWK
jgi:hypothetical protein